MLKKNLRYAALIVFGFGLALAMAELILRALLFHPPPGQYYIWPPGLVQRFRPDPKVFRGIQGESVFTVDANGFRSSADTSAPDSLYLVLGGSTAECLYLDDGETWPALLQARCRAYFRKHILFENGGRSGHSSRHHVLQLRYLLPQHPAIKTVFLLCGINDLLTHLQFEKEGSPAFTEYNYLDKAFLVRPIASYHPFYKRSACWHLFRMIAQARRQKALASKVQDAEGNIFQEWRLRRLNRTADLSALPDLKALYAEYRENLDTLCAIARRQGTRLVLITQPVLWRDSLSPQLDSLLWTGGPVEQDKGYAYYRPSVLRAGMDSLNQIMREVAVSRQVRLIDLAAILDADTDLYYDDCHFNEYGAGKVADAVFSEWIR